MPHMFTVRLQNEPGTLAALAEALAERGVDIRSVGAAVVGDAGHTVLLTNDDATTHDVLEAAGYAFSKAEAVHVHVEDRPGALARVARSLAEAGVNIEGVLVLGRYQGKAELAVAVRDPARARRALGLS